MPTDIIDRIDQLVDDSLAAGEPEGGYEHWNTEPDPNYPQCPRCHRHWHGLPITARIASMYARSLYDPDYEYATDTSPILCEGSDFIGPMRPPPQLGRSRKSDLGFGYVHIDVDFTSWDAAMDRLRQAFEDFGARVTAYNRTWQPTWTFTVGNFRLPATEPPACLQPAIEIEFGPQNWHHEIRRPQCQFPRSFFIWTPLEYAVSELWHDFCAPDFPIPPSPGYDFTAWTYGDAPTTGPHQTHGWNALNGARSTSAARRRNGAARKPTTPANERELRGSSR